MQVWARVSDKKAEKRLRSVLYSLLYQQIIYKQQLTDTYICS